VAMEAAAMAKAAAMATVMGVVAVEVAASDGEVVKGMGALEEGTTAGSVEGVGAMGATAGVAARQMASGLMVLMAA